MRNGFNQFNVPYMNELTANALGGAAQFGGNMPLGFINFSLDQIAGWLQDNPQTGAEPCPYPGGCGPPGRITSGGVFDRIIKQLPGQTPTPTGTPPIAGGCPPGQKEYYDILGFKHCGAPMVSDGKGTMGDEPTHSGQKIGGILGALGIGSDVDVKDMGKRFGLVILGAVLLVVALISLSR